MVFLASDHNGFNVKQKIMNYLTELQIDYTDVGDFCLEKTDSYVDFAKKATEFVTKTPNSKGIYICGTGIGFSIVANRYKGARAVVCHDEKTAKICREHNDANILCLGANVNTFNKMCKIIKIFLNTEFLNGRHLERVNSIDN